jgi:type VI secretion system secreted protein Hcp
VSWAWVVANDVVGSGGGSGMGKATPGDFHFTHLYDKGSPVIAKYCASGKHFADATLTSRKAGEGQKDFLVIKFKEVFIKSVQPSGSSGGDIVESVTLSYKEIEFAYKPQDDKGGLGGEVKFGWNNATTEIT